MIVTCCDFCEKRIKTLVGMITVKVRDPLPTPEISVEGEYHYHRECFTRIVNKLKGDD